VGEDDVARGGGRGWGEKRKGCGRKKKLKKAKSPAGFSRKGRKTKGLCIRMRKKKRADVHRREGPTLGEGTELPRGEKGVECGKAGMWETRGEKSEKKKNNGGL